VTPYREYYLRPVRRAAVNDLLFQACAAPALAARDMIEAQLEALDAFIEALEALFDDLDEITGQA
jgi:hypothetical protein